MIKPLREAYESYERMRLEEEAVKSTSADSPETSTTEKGLESNSDVQIFRDKRKGSKEKLIHSSIKNQVLM